MTIGIHDWQQLDEPARDALLTRPAVASDTSIRADVTAIIDSVRNKGDAAVSELTERLDRIRLDGFRVSAQEIESATATLGDGAIRAIDLAITNVERFHRRQMPQPITVETMPGVVCERVSHPIDAVGLYVPAGTAPLYPPVRSTYRPSTGITAGLLDTTQDKVTRP